MIPPTSTRPRLFALVRAGFGQRRKMLRRSLAGLASTPQLRAAGIRPEARAEELSIAGLGGADQGRRAGRLSPMPSDVVRAPAKLTLSLRIIGRPRRRLPPARRRDGDAGPRTTRSRSPAATASRSAGRSRPGSPPATETSSAEPFAPSGAPQRSASTSRSLPAAAWAAARPTPPPCCAGPAATTWTWPPRLGADVPFCLVGGRARVTGVGEVLEPLPFEDQAFTLVVPPLQVVDRRGLPGLGRARRPPQRRTQRPRAGGAGGGAPAAALARPHPGGGRACSRAGRQRRHVVPATGATPTWPARSPPRPAS